MDPQEDTDPWDLPCYNAEAPWYHPPSKNQVPAMDLVIARRVLPGRYLVLDVVTRRHLGQVPRALRAAILAHWRAICERIRARWLAARAQQHPLNAENLRALG